MSPVEKGFHKVRHDQFKSDEKPYGGQGAMPPGKEGQRQTNRDQGRQRRTDVRQKPKNRSAEAPEEGVWNADEVQSRADHQAVRRIYKQLQQGE